MNINEFIETAKKSEVEEALRDPTTRQQLRDLGREALYVWVRSPQFTKQAPYFQTIASVVFAEGGLPRGSYDRAVSTLLQIWREFGWVRTETRQKGWVTTTDLSTNSVRAYRNMTSSHDPEVRARGARLLHREVANEALYLQTTVSLRALAQELLDEVGTDAMVGQSREVLVETLGAPKRVVNEVVAIVKELGGHTEKVVRTGGKPQRVLVATEVAS